MLPLFVLPGPPDRHAAAGHHPRVVQPQRLDERDDDRAVQRGRRAAGQAVRPAARRGRSRSAPAPRGCATSASRRPCTRGRSSSRSPWWRRSPRRWCTASAATTRSPDALDTGTVVTLALLLTRLYGPLTALSNARVDIMSALVSFDRVFEVLDLPPMIDDAPDAIELPRDARSIEFDDVHFSYPTAREVSLASLEDVAVLDTAPAQEVLHGVSFRAEPGRAGRARRAVRCRQDDDQPAGAAHVRRAFRAGAGRRSRRARGDPAVAARPDRRREPGRAHVPRHDPRRTCVYAAPAATDARVVGGASRRRRSATSSWRRCPMASTRSWATAATGCPVARSSAWRSPGCC